MRARGGERSGVGQDIEGPALQHLLAGAAGDDQHHLLQLPRKHPVCGAGEAPTVRTGLSNQSK